MSVRTSKPSVAEVRAVVQPEGLLDRVSGEHWAGRLYVRRLSPYATWLLLRTPVTPNGVTWLMLLSGVCAAAVLTLPGILPAVAAVLLIQLQILFDCSDGEVARWQQRYSPVGVYIDRMGHYLTESLLPVALGIRADGGFDSIGGWTTLGLVVAVLVLLIKSETTLIYLARATAGKPVVEDVEDVAAPRPAALRRIRRLLGFVPFFRAFVAMEATVLILAAAVIDEIAGDLTGTRTLLTALVPVGAVTAVGHLVAVLTSSRLR
jgi:phosphatidylglycerophosphate synthase